MDISTNVFVKTMITLFSVHRFSLHKKTLFFLFCLVQSATVLGEPSGLGLLKGVEASRLPRKNIEMSFRYTMENHPPISFRTYMKYPFRFIDQEAVVEAGKEILPYSTVMVKENEVTRYINDNDVHTAIYDMEYVMSNISVVAFDPRILGMSDYMSIKATVPDCLQYKYGGKVSIEGNVEYNGINTWLVRVVDDDTDSRFWIEEPSFRVHRVVHQGFFGFVDICSYYDAGNEGPLPSCVDIIRKDPNGEVEMDKKIEVTDINYNPSISDSFFSLRSMKLPVNAEVVDYRISHRIGYWDGEKLVDAPVKMSALEQREWEAKQKRQPLGYNIIRYIMIGIGIVLIVVPIAFKIRNLRKNV